MGIPAEQLIDLAMFALETAAFMITDPVDEAGRVSSPRLSTIRVDGPDTGARLLLEATDGFLAELASGMLGSEPEQITQEEGSQALMELANILGGEIVMALGGREDSSLTLGLPETPAREDLAAFERSSTRVGLDSSGGTLNISLLLKE